MFTGLIEETGMVAGIERMTDGLRLTIEAGKILEDISVDDSICINGACQTVVKFNQDSFTVEAVGETLDKTTFSKLKPGTTVNLERSLTLGKRLGGHLVQGHVNGVGSVKQWQSRGDNYLLEIQLPPDLMRYCIREGSVAVDGISLTISGISPATIQINVIPHTVKRTTLQHIKIGDEVNIEVDVIARFIEKFLEKSPDSGLTRDKLRQWGY